MKRGTEELILFEMYRRAFAASTPKGDFDEMLKNAEINEFGEKTIPFNDYECKSETMEKIIQDVLKEHKVPKHKHSMFRFSFILGCSPRSK